MTDPIVCAVMLTRDRPAMARRAVESFRKQHCASLFIVNSGADQMDLHESNVEEYWVPYWGGHKSIGELRNIANETAGSWFEGTRKQQGPDIFLHWDSDDWSHPNRIAEQVALLQSSGADAVGYREMLFWDTRGCGPDGWRPEVIHQPRAWLFTHPSPSYVLGTSLCYWRKTWERKPFPDVSKGEDYQWIQGMNVQSESAAGVLGVIPPITLYQHPSMIASIHGANSCNTTDPAAEIARGSQQWKRVPEWDSYCRERMAL